MYSTGDNINKAPGILWCFQQKGSENFVADLNRFCKAYVVVRRHYCLYVPLAVLRTLWNLAKDDRCLMACIKSRLMQKYKILYDFE